MSKEYAIPSNRHGSIRERAMNLLARRDHSKAELLRKLLARGFDLAAINEAIRRLESEGLQSDERFTEEYVRARVNHGFGPIKIQMELRERGVDSELIKLYIAKYVELWLQAAEQIRSKKFGEIIPHDFLKIAQQKRFLQAKGFDLEVINQVFASVKK